MKHWLFVGQLLFCGMAASAHRGRSVSDAAAPLAAVSDTLRPRPWYVPRYLVGQMAGGQGLITAGVGYSANRSRLEADVLAGYVPRKYSITAMGIFTAKITYIPWSIPLSGSGWALRPLALGGYANYTASRGLNTSRDSKYDKDYYWWSSHTRLGGFVGGRITYPLPRRQSAKPRRHASLYYELGSNDLYIVSWWHNPRTLSLNDVLTLGVGNKLDL